MSNIDEKDKIEIGKLYSDQDDHLKTHDNILNNHHDILKKHSEILGNQSKNLEDVQKDVEDINGELEELKPVVQENRDANVTQNIMMEHISDNVEKMVHSMEGTRKDSKAMFKWLLTGFTVIIGTMGGFMIWMLKLLITIKTGGAM